MKLEDLVIYPHFSHIIYVGKYDALAVTELPKIKTVIASSFFDLNFKHYLEKELPKAQKIYLDNNSEYSYSYITEKITGTKRKVFLLIDDTVSLIFCKDFFKQKNAVVALSEEAFPKAHKLFKGMMVQFELTANKKRWYIVNI